MFPEGNKGSIKLAVCIQTHYQVDMVEFPTSEYSILFKIGYFGQLLKSPFIVN